MADLRDILESDTSRVLLLLALVATVLFTDIVRQLLGVYSLATKATILVLIVALLAILYGDTNGGDGRGQMFLLDPFVWVYDSAQRWKDRLERVKSILRRGWESDVPEEGDERGQIGTLLDIILIFVEPVVQWAVDNYEFLIMLAIGLWALDASGVYPAVDILADAATVAVNTVVGFLQWAFGSVIDWFAEQIKNSI